MSQDYEYIIQEFRDKHVPMKYEVRDTLDTHEASCHVQELLVTKCSDPTHRGVVDKLFFAMEEWLTENYGPVFRNKNITCTSRHVKQNEIGRNWSHEAENILNQNGIVVDRNFTTVFALKKHGDNNYYYEIQTMFDGEPNILKSRVYLYEVKAHQDAWFQVYKFRKQKLRDLAVAEELKKASATENNNNN